MNTNRDDLDDAIDHVVARMVRVEENDALASQIVDALPERASWFGWLFHSWAPRLAMIAIVVAAGIVWGNRKPATMPQLDPLASTLTAAQPVAFVATVREAVPTRTMPLEPVEPLQPLEPSKVDFDRSLPSIVTVASLELDSLAPAPLPSSEGLVLEPLVIADLPLTAEPISPR
jgi:hypothetical protein